jgi:hypothetical protein
VSSFGVRANRDFSSASDNEARTRENSRKRFPDSSQKDSFQVESFLWFALFAAFIYFADARVFYLSGGFKLGAIATNV